MSVVGFRVCPISAGAKTGSVAASGVTTSSLSVFVSVRVPSVTFTANDTGPFESAVAVPASVPSGASVNPAGKVPLASDQVRVPPPEAASFTEYGTPTVAGARLSLVTVSFSLMLIVKGRCEGALHEIPFGGHVLPGNCVHPRSRISTQKKKLPAWVGVPVMCPFESIEVPVGTEPLWSTNWYGGQPLRATNVKSYRVPTTPLGGLTLSSKPNAIAAGTATAATTAR